MARLAQKTVERLLELNALGRGNREIARTLGVSPSVVAYHLSRRGLQPAFSQGHFNRPVMEAQKNCGCVVRVYSASTAIKVCPRHTLPNEAALRQLIARLVQVRDVRLPGTEAVESRAVVPGLGR